MGLVVLVVSGLSLMLMVKGVLGVPIEGSIPLFMLGVALSLFATTSIGIFMGTLARSMPQLGLLMILVLLPLQMLSGGSTPRESMPQVVQDIMLTMPTTHFVSLAQAILYRGAGFGIVWPQFLTLLAIGSAFFLIALLRFRRRLARWRNWLASYLDCIVCCYNMTSKDEVIRTCDEGKSVVFTQKAKEHAGSAF